MEAPALLPPCPLWTGARPHALPVTVGIYASADPSPLWLFLLKIQSWLTLSLGINYLEVHCQSVCTYKLSHHTVGNVPGDLGEGWDQLQLLC